MRYEKHEARAPAPRERYQNFSGLRPMTNNEMLFFDQLVVILLLRYVRGRNLSGQGRAGVKVTKLLLE